MLIKCERSSRSRRSIVAPCGMPFKCSSPWIKRNPTMFRYERSYDAACLRATDGQMMISPDFFPVSYDKTFGTYSLFRSVMLSVCARCSPANTSEISQPGRVVSRALAKGKAGALDLVKLRMSRVLMVRACAVPDQRGHKIFEDFRRGRVLSLPPRLQTVPQRIHQKE